MNYCDSNLGVCLTQKFDWAVGTDELVLKQHVERQQLFIT